jgi:hypothetical protein
MDDRHDQDQGKITGENTEPGAAKASPAVGEGETPASAESDAGSQLPIIESPELGGGEAVDEPVAEEVRGAPIKSITALPALFREPVREAPRAAAAGPGRQQRSFRFALLAATIAGAAGIGALAGSLTASGLGHQNAAQPVARTAESRDIVQALKAQRAEISALKASLDSESRTTNVQFGKIAERFNNIEHAQTDQAGKLTHIAEAVDRFGKKAAAAPEITGSIAAPAPLSAPAVKPNPVVPVLRDWVVQDVRNGRAMVETRYGSMFLVASGGTLPGLGRVAEIKRQNGEWVVVTERGLITSNP